MPKQKNPKNSKSEGLPPSSIDSPPLDLHPLSPYATWAVRRNSNPILDVFLESFPSTSANVLEIASGSGMHLHYFAPNFPHLTFYPSDANQEVFEHIQLLTEVTRLPNVKPPIHLNVAEPETWQILEERKFVAIFLINLFQVVPLEIADGLAKMSAAHLAPQGGLYIYGPFKAHGEYTSPSNQKFDQALRGYGFPGWGLKDIDEVNDAAEQYGLRLETIKDMPANNFLLVYKL
jgi:cyclopropane fatty-acyl-phospholipid synthase-like methyltransferase